MGPPSVSPSASVSKRAAVLCGVYTIVCVATGLTYVGSSINIVRRWGAHRRALAKGNHHCERLQRAFNKYGDASFIFAVTEMAPANELIEAEQRHYRARQGSLANASFVAQSGMFGHNHSDSSRAAMSAARKGKKFSPEWRANMSRAKKGKIPRPPGWHHSAETRAKMSKSSLGSTVGMLGKQHSVETKAKMSDAAKRNLARGSRQRGVRIDGIEYPSGKDAAEHLGVWPPSIIKMIKAGRGSYLS